MGATPGNSRMRTRRWLLHGAGSSVAATALHMWSGSRLAVAQSEAEPGTIRGRVMHGVSGAAQDAVEVQLWYLDAATRSRRLEQTVVTDSAGHFEFAGLGIAPADLYQPTVTFGGVEYVGPVLLAAGNANAAAAGEIPVGTADIEVFDVTHDPARVRLIRSNLILAQVNVANGEVSLIQTIIVSNAGPQTFVAQPVTASPARIAPPVGAVGVAPLTGVRREDMVVTGDGGLVPATPFPPGETPLTMGYTLPYAGPRLSVTLPILQPIGQLRVLVPARGVQVESDDLRPFGVTALGDNSFTAVGATDLLPGTLVRFTLLGLPHLEQPVLWGDRRPLQVGVAAAAAAVLATLGVLAWADPRGRRTPAPTPQPTEIERLVADIRALDGKEDPAAQLQRRALKARLLELAPDIASSDRSGPRSAAAKTDVALRLCEESDLPKLEWSGTFTDQRELIRRAFERKQEGEVEMVVADIDGFPVGQIWIDFSKVRNEHTAVLWALRVLPNLQNKGIGTKLITRAVEMSREKGASIAEIGVEKDNPKAKRLYEGLGFRVVGDNVDEWEYTTPDGERRRERAMEWIMEKHLD